MAFYVLDIHTHIRGSSLEQTVLKLSVCLLNESSPSSRHVTPWHPVVRGDVRMLFLGLASVGIVAHIVRVLDVICTVNEPNSFVPPRVAACARNGARRDYRPSASSFGEARFPAARLAFLRRLVRPHGHISLSPVVRFQQCATTGPLFFCPFCS